jgi:hypothetical protein
LYFVSVVALKLVGFAGVDTLDTYVEDVLCENWPAKGWESWLQRFRNWCRPNARDQVAFFARKRHLHDDQYVYLYSEAALEPYGPEAFLLMGAYGR